MNCRPASISNYNRPLFTVFFSEATPARASNPSISQCIHEKHQPAAAATETWGIGGSNARAKWERAVFHSPLRSLRRRAVSSKAGLGLFHVRSVSARCGLLVRILFGSLIRFRTARLSLPLHPPWESKSATAPYASTCFGSSKEGARWANLLGGQRSSPSKIAIRSPRQKLNA